MWRIVVSNKEKDAVETVERLCALGVAAERGHLEVADVAFQRDDRTVAQAEFKTVADMLASIQDCRYHEQAAALEASGVPLSFYVIHGMRAPPNVSEEEQLKLEHAMTRVQGSSPGIATVYLTSQGGRVAWIRYVAQKLAEGATAGADAVGGTMAPLSEHVRHNFGSKPAGRDQAAVYVQQLGRITGISERRAQAIAARWPSWGALVEFLRGVESYAALLETMRGLGCGLGPEAVRRIYEQTLAADQRAFEPPKKRFRK